MGELQSVKTVKLSVRPLFRPNTGPRAGRGAARAVNPRCAHGHASGAPRILVFFRVLRATSLRAWWPPTSLLAWWPPSSVDRCRVVNFSDRKRTICKRTEKIKNAPLICTLRTNNFKYKKKSWKKYSVSAAL